MGKAHLFLMAWLLRRRPIIGVLGGSENANRNMRRVAAAARVEQSFFCLPSCLAAPALLLLALQGSERLVVGVQH